jgi:hypothetical protein
MLVFFAASVDQFLSGQGHEYGDERQGLHTVAKSDDDICNSSCQEEQFPDEPSGHRSSHTFRRGAADSQAFWEGQRDLNGGTLSGFGFD